VSGDRGEIDLRLSDQHGVLGSSELLMVTAPTFLRRPYDVRWRLDARERGRRAIDRPSSAFSRGIGRSRRRKVSRALELKSWARRSIRAAASLKP